MKENDNKTECNSIKENIKLLEKLDYLLDDVYSTGLVENEERNKYQYAIEHILSDYKKNIKENEHKTEKIENQKAELTILNEKQKDFNKLQNTLSSYKEQFRRQEKENEELRKKLNEENKRCMMLAIEKQDYFEKYRYHLQQNVRLTKEFSNVILVQKVKDKIEELIKEGRHYNANKIEVLQELIEKER